MSDEHHASAVDTFVAAATIGKEALRYLACSFDASLGGRWREQVAHAYRYLALRVRALAAGGGATGGAAIDDEEDVKLWGLLRAVIVSIQAVRVSPRARERLLSDALCPKPWTSDLLLYILLAMIDAVLPSSSSLPLEQHSSATADGLESDRVRVFTGSCDANELSDTQTYICATALSHECMSKLDFSLASTWAEYLALERRVYRMVLFTDPDKEIHHTAVFRKSGGNNESAQKNTALLHAMAAISAATWGRRMSHVALSGMLTRSPTRDTMGCDPSLTALKKLLADSYAEWAGTRFKLTICKGRCNALCRAHDTELFSFLSSGIAGGRASMSESVEAAFMPVPHVLKSIHGDFDALRFPEHPTMCDPTVILYLTNSVLKQRFDIAFVDRHVLIDADMTRNANAIASARYMAPCVAHGPGGAWGVLHWTPCRDGDDRAAEGTRAIFTPGSHLNGDYPLLASVAMWFKCYARHVVFTEEGIASWGVFPHNEFGRMAQVV